MKGDLPWHVNEEDEETKNSIDKELEKQPEGDETPHTADKVVRRGTMANMFKAYTND